MSRVLGESSYKLFLPDVRNELASEIDSRAGRCSCFGKSADVKHAQSIVRAVDDLQASKLEFENRLQVASVHMGSKLAEMEMAAEQMERALSLIERGDTRGAYRLLEVCDLETLKTDHSLKWAADLAKCEESLIGVGAATSACERACLADQRMKKKPGSVNTKKIVDLLRVEIEMHAVKADDVKSSIRQLQLSIQNMYRVLKECTKDGDKRAIATVAKQLEALRLIKQNKDFMENLAMAKSRETKSTLRW